MTRQTHHRYGDAWRPAETFRAVLASVSRYDLVLWAIPAAFLVAFVANALLATGVHASLVGAAIVGALVITDAIALHPPRTG